MAPEDETLLVEFFVASGGLLSSFGDIFGFRSRVEGIGMICLMRV